MCFCRKIVHKGGIALQRKCDSLEAIIKSIEQLHQIFKIEQALLFQERIEKLHFLKSLLQNNRSEIAQLIALEVGKGKEEGEREIDKSLNHIDYYEKNFPYYIAQNFTSFKLGKESMHYELLPTGVLLKIVPYNYPLWLAYKFIVPNICVGNTILLRPPSTCLQLYQFIQTKLQLADYKNLSINLFSEEDTDKIIAHPLITGVSFTGSISSGLLIR